MFQKKDKKDKKDSGKGKDKKDKERLSESSSSDSPVSSSSSTSSFANSSRDFSDGLSTNPQRNFAAFKRKYKVMKEELGSGAFSVVRLGRNRETGEEVAIKVVDKRNVSENFKKNLDREIQILIRVDHPNIVCLKDLYDAGDKFLFVMELVTGGELFDRIVQKGSYSEDDAKELVKRIVRGVHYLHTNNIAHRDLKPENLLLKSKDDDAEVKIADFGLSSFIDSQKLMQTACGTPAYVAPEVLQSSGGYDKEVDMWSVGVITYILLCGFPPFHADSVRALLQVVIKGEYSFPSPYWDPISSEAKNFISQLLTSPSKRMNAKEALQHPWLKSTGSKINLREFQSQMQRYVITRKRESQELLDRLRFTEHK
ncbi:Protein kinase domain,Protein kinase-like domain,Serine/threonine-protein kinase, active site [Balamuthia mandrillaris]